MDPVSPDVNVNKSFFHNFGSSIGNPNKPEDQVKADSQREQMVNTAPFSKPSEFLPINPDNMDPRFYTPEYMRMFGGYGALSQINPTDYNNRTDVFKREVGSAPDAALSASSTLFNYLTVTPGFTKVSSLNYQVYRDAKIQMYTPIRSLDNGKVILDSRGIIASMTPVSEKELPNAKQFAEFQNIGGEENKRVNLAPDSDDEGGDVANVKVRGVYNPNFLFFVKVSDVTVATLADALKKSKQVKQTYQFREQQGANEKKRTEEMERTDKEDAKKRNAAITGILQRDKPLFDLTEYLKNDRYFSLLKDKLIDFDIYEQNAVSGEKTYKGILKSVELECPTERGISLLSSNLKVVLNVETWVRGLIGPNVYKIEKRQIKVDIGIDYPHYFANIMEKNDNSRGSDGNNVNEVSMNAVGSKYVGRYSSLDKKTLSLLNDLLTSNKQTDVAKEIVQSFDERKRNIAAFNAFIRTPNNPFVYRFQQSDISHIDNLGFVRDKNCYEIGQNNLVKWLGEFNNLMTTGEATFTKKYKSDTTCNLNYQFNFVNGPGVLALHPIAASTKWLKGLNKLTDELSSAFQQIYKDELSTFLSQPVTNIKTFYATEKSKTKMEQLIIEFNAKLNNICGRNTDANTLLKDTIANIKNTVAELNGILNDSSGLQNGLENLEESINNIFAGDKLTCIIDFVDLSTSMTTRVNSITSGFSRLTTEAEQIQNSINNSTTSSIDQEKLKEFNEIKQQYDAKTLSNLQNRAASLGSKKEASSVQEEHKEDIDAPPPYQEEVKPDLNAPGAKYKVGDYVFISKMYSKKSSKNDQKYAVVISSYKYPDRKNGIVYIFYALRVFYEKDDYDAYLNKFPTINTNAQVVESSLMPADENQIELYFTPNELGGGAAKHTRRSHTGLRKNVTRHGKHGLNHRRTSHKGRKRLAYSKTAKK